MALVCCWDIYCLGNRVCPHHGNTALLAMEEEDGFCYEDRSLFPTL